MRAVLRTLVVVFGLSLVMIGCTAPRQDTIATIDPGQKTRVVRVQILPASANAKSTVKLVPPLASFRPEKHPDGLVFVKNPQGTAPTWEKVGVSGFTNVTSSPPTSIGNPKGSCDDLGTDENASDRCRVVFKDPGDSDDFYVVKYSIELYETGSTTPDLVIDPVAIIMG